MQPPLVEGPLDKTMSVDKITIFQQFLYYLSFILVFGTLAFIASMLMMGYEDRTGSLQWKSGEMQLSDKIGLITFYILQLPLGLLFGLLTGNFNIGLFAFLLNPLLFAWTLQKFIFRTQCKSIRRTLQVNYTVWIAIILAIIIYVVTE
jgi:hypothetical protein